MSISTLLRIRALPCGGARVATLSYRASLCEELACGRGCSRPAAPWASERRGRNHWNDAACLLTSWCLSTTESTASPKRPEGNSRAAKRKTLSRSLISNRVNQRCLSAATRAAIDHLMARAVSLVARRDKSAVLRSSLISFALNPSPSSNSLSRSAWYACNTAMVCKHEPALPAATYLLPTSADDARSGLVGRVGAFRDDARSEDR